ncbi:phytanoyl-CoA dioxygenase family protein [Salinispora cortesiana]|uniref:phytanoyl-CoA dioxygenase family protein n=1 Tax=Salinispora cortesiana TaxID=1305843 RepID=UPI00041188F2|nr:phytanoyl-CoA dioxygenase family protein [Salinispora cortesiana]
MLRTETEAAGPLTRELLARYRRDGYVLLAPDFLAEDVPAAVTSAIPSAVADDSPRRILERDGTTVRSVYGLHQTHPTIAGLARLPQLLGAVRQILGDDVYVHQSKINFKEPFSGDQWEWHQDYVYWLQNDGVQAPDLVNAAIFVDEVTEFNGPLTFVPGSHRHGLLAGQDLDGMPLGYEDAPAWVATLTANEKFRVEPAVIEDLARREGLVSPKGPAGSLLLFDPNILHSSAPNISPFRRAMLMFVYNSVSNSPRPVATPRPPFLADPDVRPLQPLSTRPPQ